MFAVIRHPDVAVAGFCPESAYRHQRAAGWYRVSEWSERTDVFVLANFGPDLPDLDPDLVEDPDLPDVENDPESTKESTA